MVNPVCKLVPVTKVFVSSVFCTVVKLPTFTDVKILLGLCYCNVDDVEKELAFPSVCSAHGARPLVLHAAALVVNSNHIIDLCNTGLKVHLALHFLHC